MRKPEESQEEEYTKREKSVGRELLETILYIAVVAFVCFLIITFVGQRTTVSGQSMEPLLQDGDNLILDKLTYHFREPERFDVVVFDQTEEDHYIKRVIGLPGETVQIIDGYVYINGEKLEDDVYGKEVMLSGMRAEQPVTLGEDEYFVLGDNRNYSRDSRDPGVGNVKRSQILGRAWLRFWPLNKLEFIRHQ